MKLINLKIIFKTLLITIFYSVHRLDYEINPNIQLSLMEYRAIRTFVKYEYILVEINRMYIVNLFIGGIPSKKRKK